MIMSTVKVGIGQRIKIYIRTIYNLLVFSPCLVGMVELIATTIAHTKKNLAQK